MGATETGQRNHRSRQNTRATRAANWRGVDGFFRSPAAAEVVAAAEENEVANANSREAEPPSKTISRSVKPPLFLASLAGQEGEGHTRANRWMTATRGFIWKEADSQRKIRRPPPRMPSEILHQSLLDAAPPRRSRRPPIPSATCITPSSLTPPLATTAGRNGGEEKKKDA